MGKPERDKGLRGELEVKHLFEEAGFPIRGLEGQGDNLVMLGGGQMLHLEVKRRERVTIQEWIRQADAEKPPLTIPIVVWRTNHMKWQADLPAAGLLELLKRGRR